MKKFIFFTLLCFLTLSFAVSGQIGGSVNSFNHHENLQVAGRVFWRGMVDKKVHLVIQDLSLKTNTIDGNEQPAGVFSFTTALPRRSVSVGVKKTSGRGKAQVIQQPNEDNDYTAIVEVIDEKGGAKEYQIEIFWQ